MTFPTNFILLCFMLIVALALCFVPKDASTGIQALQMLFGACLLVYKAGEPVVPKKDDASEKQG